MALAGNPNSGKTTLFNALTGARQHVGNYPGVTVEEKEGQFRQGDLKVRVLDLPGTYSLTAHSPEELVARNVVLEQNPAVVVDVVDASNLERNLYLATQFMELGVPMILAFNMVDVAEARGQSIDIDLLSKLLNVRIIKTVGSKRQGIAELRQAILEVCLTEQPEVPTQVTYGRHIESELRKVTEAVETFMTVPPGCSARWLALKLLEDDEVVLEQILARARDASKIVDQKDKSRQHLARELGDDAEILIADRRYGFISGACQETVRTTVESRHSMSDRIDWVMTHRVLSIPIFLFLMFLVFKLTFTVGEPFMTAIEMTFAWLSGAINSVWPEGAAPLLHSLIVDGIIGGVGGVIVFLPNIMLLFLAIAFLEDTGYMARAAFIMDRFMHHIGLHGKSFIPMLIGFGCTVPAIMATRTLENRRDRLTTMLIAPLMSCGARLPIYVLIIPAFFPEEWHARMMFLIYFIGIALAVICARILRSTVLKGSTEPFVMELPPYRLPTFRGVVSHMWERGWLYLKKAGTVILGISVLMWVLVTFPRSQGSEGRPAPEIGAVQMAEEAVSVEAERSLDVPVNRRRAEALSHTFAGRLGHAMVPLIKPLGFDWRIGTALIGAFAAKEVFVAQMGIVYAVGDTGEDSAALRDKLRANYTPLQAFCIMLFCLVSTPCVATIAVTRRESNSWGWALFQLSGLTVLAYLLTLVVYQLGQFLGIGT